MSKGTKILILVLLIIVSSSVFTMTQKAGYAQATAFFAFAIVGLLIAILVVALSRRESRRR
jgi:ABC-type sugar transport system permease subunit